MADAQQLGGVGHVDAALRLGDALEAECQVGQHRQMRKQAGFLEHVAQRALVRRDEDPVVAVLPDFIVDLDKALLSPLQAGDAAQASGLARAGVAVKRSDATARHLQIDVQGEARIT
ncbi:hypothetical protein D3C75_636650 [compost metagenome]